MLKLLVSLITITVEPQFNKPLYNKVLDITNNILLPGNSKIYEKETWYKEILL